MFIFQKSRSFVVGPRGMRTWGECKANYRGFLRDSALDSPYSLPNCPISEVSVTWGVGTAPLQLSPSFERDVVLLTLPYRRVSSLVFG